MKKLVLFLLLAVCMAACKIECIGFSNPASPNDAFFCEVLAQARERGNLSDTTKPTGTVDIYRVRFREQRIEQSNVLEWRMISENDPRFNHTDSNVTSGQNIYIYRLHMSDPQEDVFVYYTMAVNAENNQCTGVGHAFLGKLDEKNGISNINFYERLEFKQEKSVSKLVPEKKSARRKGNRFQDVLRITLKHELPRGLSYLSISKLAILEINKTGGNNPVFYPVDEILGDYALLMTKQ